MKSLVEFINEGQYRRDSGGVILGNPLYELNLLYSKYEDLTKVKEKDVLHWLNELEIPNLENLDVEIYDYYLEILVDKLPTLRICVGPNPELKNDPSLNLSPEVKVVFCGPNKFLNKLFGGEFGESKDVRKFKKKLLTKFACCQDHIKYVYIYPLPEWVNK